MKRCLNCMEIYQDEFDVCPFCGYVENTVSEIPYALPASTVIADRYIIGTVIGAGGFGITYIAWDTKLEIRIAVKEYFPTGLVNRIPGTLQVGLTGTHNEQSYEKRKKRDLLRRRRLWLNLMKNSGVVNVFDCIEAKWHCLYHYGVHRGADTQKNILAFVSMMAKWQKKLRDCFNQKNYL